MQVGAPAPADSGAAESGRTYPARVGRCAERAQRATVARVRGGGRGAPAGAAYLPQAAFAWFHKIVQAHLPLAEHEILSCAIALGHEDPSAPENACITERAAVGDFASFHGFD